MTDKLNDDINKGAKFSYRAFVLDARVFRGKFLLKK